MNQKLIVALIAFFSLSLIAFADTKPSMSDTATQLYNSLTEDQKKEATLPYDSPEKKSEVFTGGKRPGIQIKTLTEQQQKQAMDLLTAFTSEKGKQTALAITLQKPDNPDSTAGFLRYYLCYFGEPGPDKTFAWRISEHHLTLVHVEFENGHPTTFGPILIGANPPTLFDEEEEKMIALYNAMTAEEKAQCENPGKGISSFPAQTKAKSIKIGDLSPTAKDAAKAVVENRLGFFSDEIKKQIQSSLDAQGGTDALQVYFYGEATKKCREGGMWDFKLATKDFLCDYENTRKHIHLSVKSQPPKQPK
jgi:hypothetical protein